MCVYLGKSRNYRSVHIPVINGNEASNINGIKQEWTAQAFVHPEHHSKFNIINEVFRSKVGISD